jgi:hypothetical protein
MASADCCNEGVRRKFAAYTFLFSVTPHSFFKLPSMSTRGRGRPKKPNDTTGESNTQPRSLARVFHAIRKQCGDDVSQSDMYATLAAQPSRYRMPKPRETTGDEHLLNGAAKKPPRQDVAPWESPNGQPTFAVLHRYALTADTFTGVLHITSLFYAHFRDAGLKKGAKRQQHLDFINAVSAALITFAQTAQANTATFDKKIAKSFRFARDEHANSDAELDRVRDDFVNSLLDAFRNNSTLQACDKTVDRGHAETPTPKKTRQRKSRLTTLGK